MKNPTGDMPNNEFRKYGHEVVDMIADYLEGIENFPVVPNTQPGDIYSLLPADPPETGELFDKILKDYNELILPGITHWNHPKFMAFFNSNSSGPGILAELITAALNSNGMIWKTSPALTELEEKTLEWFRDILSLPKNLFGIIYDTASISTMHAIACAREQADNSIRMEGYKGKTYTLYTSEHAHSSVEKGAIVLGLGMENVRKISTDSLFRLNVQELEAKIKEDIAAGKIPVCVSATIGTTSITSVDPVQEIAALCKIYNIWLHVDAAYAGVTAMLEECSTHFKGIEEADSIVINPHKWLYIPTDLSVFYTSKPDILKKAFSLVPEYLRTSHDNTAINLMDYGIQLGRRFRALKLWFTIKYFGVKGLKSRLRDNIRLAKKIEDWVLNSKKLELIAPVNFSTVCFRYLPHGVNDLGSINSSNSALLNLINLDHSVLLSHTVVNGMFVIRIVTAGLRTNDRHIEEVINLIEDSIRELESE